MKYLNTPIGYLEDQDFNDKGILINPEIPRNIPVVVMIQTSWCPHCTNSKPAFQEFADQNKGKVFCATIQADGDKPSEKILGKRVKMLKPGFQGFPDYSVYLNGQLMNREIKGRGVADLVEFSSV